MQVKDETGATDISENDILEAMKQIPGYIDITPADFRSIYQVAFQKARQRLRDAVRVRDIMTRSVITIQADALLSEVAQLLNRHKISGAPVVNRQEQVQGVISEKDLLTFMGTDIGDSFMALVAKCLTDKGCPAVSARKQTAADLMSRPAITVFEDVSVYDVSTLMKGKQINRLPVTDRDGRLKGIVTRSSLVLSYCRTTI